MPGFFTHYQFGLHAVNQISDKTVRKSILSHREAYCLGLEGPDIFFYHLPCYLLGKRNIGNRIHDEKVFSFFEALFNARNTLAAGEEQSIADSYICGFIGHYTLDCATHPYIFARTGHFQVISERGQLFDFSNHVSLETDIDNVVMRHYLHKRPSQFDYAGAVSLSAFELEVVTNLLTMAIRRAYPDAHVSSLIVKGAIGSFTRLNKAMRDPSGIKKKAVRSLEQLIFGHCFVSAMIPSDRIIKFKDPCNLRHKSWRNPWNASDVSNDSILDIIDENTSQYLDRIEMYYDSISIGIHASYNEALGKKNALLQDLGNNSYSSGLPVE